MTDVNTNLDVIENIIQFERSFLPLPVDRSLDSTSALTITSAADGSTNAVMRSNRNLIAMATVIESKELTDEDIVLVSGLHTHNGFAMLLHAIESGLKIVIADRVKCFGKHLTDLCNRFGITTVLLNDSQLDYYREYQDKFPSLKNLWITGKIPANSSKISHVVKNVRKGICISLTERDMLLWGRGFPNFSMCQGNILIS